MKKSNLVLFIVVFISFNSFAQNGFNVDVLPTNIGGKAEFKRIFEQELLYPPGAIAKNTSGKVTISFTLMKDSSVTNARVTEKVFNDVDAEALRLFRLYQWVPAMKGGQYVNTDWSVSFEFNVDKYAKLCKARGYKYFNYLPNSTIDSSGKIYKSPEQYPMYPKGNYALQDFIKANLEYPRQAQLSNIQGTVLLRFVVEPSGLITNIGVVKSVGGGCDQEAIRILEMIKWYPGKMNDKLARVEMTLPVYFILNEDFKDNSSGEQK